MATLITVDQQINGSVAFTDRNGNPAVVDGVPAWSSSDPAVLAVTPADDGMSALVVPVGPLGTAQVSVRADADLGEGVREIIGTADVEVVAGEAVAAVVTFGAPEPRPAA